MIRAVAGVNLSQSLMYVEVPAVRPGGHVTVRQRVYQIRPFLGELEGEDVEQLAFGGLVNRTGVMGDQAAQSLVGARHITQVAGAVKGMKPGVDQLRGVTDVMKIGGSGQRVGLVAEDRGQRHGPRRHPLGVRPAPRKRLGKESFGQITRPGSLLHEIDDRRTRLYAT